MITSIKCTWIQVWNALLSTGIHITKNTTLKPLVFQNKSHNEIVRRQQQILKVRESSKFWWYTSTPKIQPFLQKQSFVQSSSFLILINAISVTIRFLILANKK